MKRVVYMFLCMCFCVVLAACDGSGTVSVPDEVREEAYGYEVSEEMQAFLAQEDVMAEIHSRFLDTFGDYNDDEMNVFMTYDDTSIIFVVGLLIDYEVPDEYMESLKIIVDTDVARMSDDLYDLAGYMAEHSTIDGMKLRLLYVLANGTEVTSHDFVAESFVV